MVEISDVCVRAGSFSIRDVSFTVGKGEYFVLLGPTGAGKTLLIESICGLRTVKSGAIAVDGVDVTRVDPAMRRIGYVPQDYALLPFKTVEANICFGIEAHGVNRDEVVTRTGELMSILGISHLKDRHIHGLSGGERQRVALGRALAIRPRLLLLDEPLSAVDEKTAETLIEDLKRLHNSFEMTIIHICHRLEEAVALADRLCLLSDGQISQIGTPRELYTKPRDLFVARFLRIPNTLDGDVRSVGHKRVFFAGGKPLIETEVAEGKAVGVAPFGSIEVSREALPDKEEYTTYKATVTRISRDPWRPLLQCTGDIQVEVPGVFQEDTWVEGCSAYISLRQTRLHVIPA